MPEIIDHSATVVRRSNSRDITRRDILRLCASSGFLIAGTTFMGFVADVFAEAERSHRLKPSPSNEMGPFYRRGAPSQSVLRAPGDLGVPLNVSGSVFDTRGEARPDATLEIWQANHHGQYDLEGYRYRALLKSSSKGQYEFESVMPGHYPDRVAQHIHYLVRAPGCLPLVTQLYFATDPAFEGDPDRNFRKDPLVLSRELVRPVMLSGDPGQPVAKVRFDLCLKRV